MGRNCQWERDGELTRWQMLSDDHMLVLQVNDLFFFYEFKVFRNYFILKLFPAYLLFIVVSGQIWDLQPIAMSNPSSPFSPVHTYKTSDGENPGFPKHCLTSFYCRNPRERISKTWFSNICRVTPWMSLPNSSFPFPFPGVLVREKQEFEEMWVRKRLTAHDLTFPC